MGGMTIGKIAQKAGVGVETIRFYERRGLVERPTRPKSSGFRLYPEETAARIGFIRHAQDLGFSLGEVGELLGLQAAPAADASDVRKRALAKLEQIDGKIERLRRMRAALKTLIAACPGKGPVRRCSIVEALNSSVPPRGMGKTRGEK